MIKSLNPIDIFINSNLVNLLVPVSRLNKGEANKVIDEVKKSGTKIICKNNKPECAMISFDKYSSMVKELEEYRKLLEEKDNDLIILTKQRIEKIENVKFFTNEEALEMFNISKEELNDIEVEFE